MEGAFGGVGGRSAFGQILLHGKGCLRMGVVGRLKEIQLSAYTGFGGFMEGRMT